MKSPFCYGMSAIPADEKHFRATYVPAAEKNTTFSFSFWQEQTTRPNSPSAPTSSPRPTWAWSMTSAPTSPLVSTWYKEGFY